MNACSVFFYLLHPLPPSLRIPGPIPIYCCPKIGYASCKITNSSLILIWGQQSILAAEMPQMASPTDMFCIIYANILHTLCRARYANVVHLVHLIGQVYPDVWWVESIIFVYKLYFNR